MAKKKPQGGGGAPDWLVTFADLMSLLVCFFVLIISFSIQDNEKLQVVAGSMKDAFGVKPVMRKAGMIEIEGMPVREYIKEVAAVAQENDSDFAQERHDQRTKQGPEANTHDIEKTEIERPRMFATAAASLRQAWQEMPEISEISKHIIIEEDKDGLNIQMVDQDGRSMFCGRLEISLRLHPPFAGQDGTGPGTHAEPDQDHRPHNGDQRASPFWLYRLGIVL